jgi:hypothetical protein
VVADGQAHRAHRHPPHRQRARGGALAAAQVGGARVRPRALLAARARPRDGEARGAGVLRTARRPPGVGLRRVRGHHHAGDPRAAPGLVPVARRRARRRDRRRRGRPLRPRHRRGARRGRRRRPRRPRPHPARAGSMRRRPSAGGFTSARAPSRCSATNARWPASTSGTPPEMQPRAPGGGAGLLPVRAGHLRCCAVSDRRRRARRGARRSTRRRPARGTCGGGD